VIPEKGKSAEEKWGRVLAKNARDQKGIRRLTVSQLGPVGCDIIASEATILSKSEECDRWGFVMRHLQGACWSARGLGGLGSFTRVDMSQQKFLHRSE